VPKSRIEHPTQTASPVTILRPRAGASPAKLGEVEVTITPENAHLFVGAKIVGFVLWNNDGDGLSVQLPSRRFSVHGQPRTFSILRSASGDPAVLQPLRQYILDEFAAAQSQLE
jgi:hypothetical protein